MRYKLLRFNPLLRNTMKKLLVLCLLMLPALSEARVEPREGEEPITAEPNVTIVQDKGSVMHIHQVNGKIYGIKVVPTTGVPYYLVDPNGEGKFIRNSSEKMLVPEWVLLSW